MTKFSKYSLLVAVFMFSVVDVMYGQVTWFYDVAYLEVPGVDPNLLSLDVGIPGGTAPAPAPVLIYVHGGGWTAGDKANVLSKGDYFTSKGWVFVSVNYRLSPFPFEIDNPDRLMYPVHTRDVASAIAFVLTHVDDYGGDSDRVSLMGHSTGAHIVSQIATDPDYLHRVGYDPSILRCVCSNDVAAYDVPAWLASDDANKDLYHNAFGLDTATWIEASPLHQESAGDHDMPDMLIIKRGRSARKQQADDFYNAIASHSESRVDIYDADPLTHAEVNQLIGDTVSQEGHAITQIIDQWLEPCASLTVSTNSSAVDQDPIIVTSSDVEIIADGELVVYDLQGRLMSTLTCRGGERTSLQNLSAGMYVLVMYTDGGLWTTKYYHQLR